MSPVEFIPGGFQVDSSGMNSTWNSQHKAGIHLIRKNIQLRYCCHKYRVTTKVLHFVQSTGSGHITISHVRSQPSMFKPFIFTITPTLLCCLLPSPAIPSPLKSLLRPPTRYDMPRTAKIQLLVRHITKSACNATTGRNDLQVVKNA